MVSVHPQLRRAAQVRRLLDLGYPQADAHEEADRCERNGTASVPAGTVGVMCAWCGLVMKEGDPAAPVSHGMCRTCERKVEEEL